MQHIMNSEGQFFYDGVECFETLPMYRTFGTLGMNRYIYIQYCVDSRFKRTFPGLLPLLASWYSTVLKAAADTSVHRSGKIVYRTHKDFFIDVHSLNSNFPNKWPTPLFPSDCAKPSTACNTGAIKNTIINKQYLLNIQNTLFQSNIPLFVLNPDNDLVCVWTIYSYSLFQYCQLL